MAQQDFGPMQKVAEFFGKGGKKEDKSPPKKEDTSWHDEMVKKANESIAKNATQKVGGGVPPAPTKKTTKVTTRKRITRKT